MNSARAICLSICIASLPLTALALHAQVRTRPAVETGRQSWSAWTDSGWMRLGLAYQGRFELTDDERDVKSVSPGGSLELTGRGWLSLFGRRYIVRGNPDGTITRRYIVGAAERPLDAAARAWIGDTIQSLAQQGFAADVRVARILATTGPEGVLDEVPRISGDWAKARYLKLLFADAPPAAAITERAIGEAAREIGSDFEKAEVLITITQEIRFDDTLLAAFGRASSTIDSDYEHARVLLATLDTQSRTPALLEMVTGSGNRIGSDYEKARVLLKVIETQPIDATTRPKLIDAARSIGSEYERSRVLSALALH